MKEQILQLRELGYSYRRIASELGCPKSLVAYHLSPLVKQKQLERSKLSNKARLSKKVNGFKTCKKYYRRLKVDSVKQNYTVKDVLEKFGEEPTCYLTGRKVDLSNTSSWHFDHIVPIAKGGSPELSNMGIACRDANMVKVDLSVEELLTICKEILEHNGYQVLETNTRA